MSLPKQMTAVESPNSDDFGQGSTELAGAKTEVHMKKRFGPMTLISVGWNMVNVFGGLSYVFVIGASAGGLPTIVYGFLGSSICVLCLTAILAECAASFPTAGGAYHFSTFLSPPEYRKAISYHLGWLNYLGWLFTIAACCSISTGLTYSLVILINPGFVVTSRWQLFLVYLAWNVFAWAVNVFALPLVQVLSNIGCWVSLTGFVGFCITLLAMAPKASAPFVFKDIVDKTGFNSESMAVAIGLYNSISVFVSLDAPCHLAEEVPKPEITIPKVLLGTTFAQILVGIIWVLTIGFSITDPDAIVNSPTGVPILEVVRLGLHSREAAIVFNLVLLILYVSATCGATVTTSRQGFALARDGGMIFNNALSFISPRFRLPANSVHFATVLTALLGLVFWFSTQGFNALLGSGALFMIESYACPSIIMLCFGRQHLTKTRYSLGKLALPCCIISVLYGIASTVLLMLPGSAPVTPSNMNYACVFFGICFIGVTSLWFMKARNTYRAPVLSELLAGI